MNFKDIPLKYTYESDKDDLVWDFYIPMLSNAKRYDRISGFFSSTSLALAARGLAGLIERGGTMRLITCPRLSAEDSDMLSQAVENTDDIISNRLINDIESVEDQFQADHIAALGWMIAKGYLEIRIALVKKGNYYLYGDNLSSHPIMHQKVGILYDEDFNGVSFSGSNNESASGWLENIEEFKVFKEWNPGQCVYFKEDQKKFDEFWSNNRQGVKVISLPEAVSKKLIESSKDFDWEKVSLKNYYNKKNKGMPKKSKPELKPFFYQKKAIDKWLDCDKRILLEMATGSGKTRTAIGCMQEFLKDTTIKQFVVVACPQNTLSVQWKNDIDSLKTYVDHSIICDGTAQGWRAKLRTAINQLMVGFIKNLIVYTTHQTCSSEDFISIVKSCNPTIKKLFIGDEVHGMGANKTRNGLLEEYEYRIGLSATPSRWFDDEGSQLILDYFGNNSFQFTIQDALSTINPATNKTFLVNYYYHPRFVNLSENELEDYKSISEKLSKMARMDKSSLSDIMQFLRFKRANIEKNAEYKYDELESILDEIEDISDTIIFVSDEQLDKVMKILGSRNIPAHKFTEAESTQPSSRYGGLSEREYLIKKFISRDYKVLVAIKCLDEGIDIPSAKRAIVMASSTNPREYVQRIGRIIRQAPGKTQADIYDLILKPDTSGFRDDILAKYEKKVFEKEMVRVKELSENALNNSSILNIVYQVMEETI